MPYRVLLLVSEVQAGRLFVALVFAFLGSLNARGRRLRESRNVHTVASRRIYESTCMPTSPTSASAGAAAAAGGRLPPARPPHDERGRRVHVRAQLSHLMGTSWNRQGWSLERSPRVSKCGPLSDWRSAVGAELRFNRPHAQGLVAAATQRRVAAAEANLAPDWDR